MKKIVITGGHLTPALAVIEELKRRKNWEIFFIGRKYALEGEKTPSIEKQQITERGVVFVPLTTGRIQRKLNRYTLLTLLKIPFGLFQSFLVLRKIKPVVILSFGGYLSVPIVIAGWLLGIPIITHEQTMTIGLASRVNVLFAWKIAVSWPSTGLLFPKNKTILTGNPIRKEFFKPSKKIWQILNFNPEVPTIFITGGNIGSRVINQVVGQILPKLLEKYNIFHQCGHATGDYEILSEIERKLPVGKEKRYHLKKYLDSQEMASIMNFSNLIISRAGANTVTEIAFLGKPALFIPLPWSRSDEQNKNAQLLTKIGTAEILPQNELNPKSLLIQIEKMMFRLGSYQINSSQAKKLVEPKAARVLADLLEQT